MKASQEFVWCLALVRSQFMVLFLKRLAQFELNMILGMAVAMCSASNQRGEGNGVESGPSFFLECRQFKLQKQRCKLRLFSLICGCA